MNIEAKCQFYSENNVAVVGNMGHGKSHLVQALKLHSKGKNEVLEEFTDGLLRADDSRARRFRYEDTVIYETPGLVTTAGSDYVDTMAKVFTKHPPKLIVIVFRPKNKTDEAGLPEFIDRLKRFNPDNALPKMFLVITECYLIESEEEVERYAKEVCDKIGCGIVPIFAVNSAQAKMRGGAVFLPSGIPELWNAILSEMSSRHAHSPIKIRSWAETMKSFVTVKNTVYAGGMVAAGAWVVVMKTPPPPMLLI